MIKFDTEAFTDHEAEISEVASRISQDYDFLTEIQLKDIHPFSRLIYAVALAIVNKRYRGK